MVQLKQKLLGLTALRYKKLPMLLENMKKMAEINDPVSLLIRCHLITEALLDELIELAFLPNGTAITSSNLSYEKKLQIASKAKLDVDWPLLPDFVIGSLRKLNSLRNKMAHKLGATISLKDVMELFMEKSHPVTATSEENINLVIYRYTAFIFGNLLPKYEAIDEA